MVIEITKKVCKWFTTLIPRLLPQLFGPTNLEELTVNKSLPIFWFIIQCCFSIGFVLLV